MFFTLYPFGFGLSYTTFAYSNLIITQKCLKGDIHINVDEKNTGNRKRDEVVQLYMIDKVSSVIAYDSQLCGFERVSLLPGEIKHVKFTLKPTDLKLSDKDMHWVVDPESFEVTIGSSSGDNKLNGEFILNN